jgi:hypothetical protein
MRPAAHGSSPRRLCKENVFTMLQRYAKILIPAKKQAASIAFFKYFRTFVTAK